MNIKKEFLHKIDEFLSQNLNTEEEFITQISEYLNKNGGKRIRPQICYLVGSSLNCENTDLLIQVSGIIELIHCATLMHDDVIDATSIRRNNKTIHEKWSVPAAILVGDFLYSRAFQLATKLNNPDIIDTLATSSNMLAEGEVSQLINLGKESVNEEIYLSIAYKKTGVLFAAGCKSAAIIANAPQEVIKSSYILGKNIGIAFQIIDDILDYMGNEKLTGKKVGTDFYEGKYTLPLIHMIKNTNLSKELLNGFGSNNPNQLKKVIAEMYKTKSKEYCLTKAKTLIDDACNSFIANTKPSKSRDTLIKMLNTLVSRKY